MRHKTARQLAEENDFSGTDDLFTTMVDFVKEGLTLIAKGEFNSLCSSGQNQLLKFCSDNNDTDAYNFYQSLI